MKPSAPGKRRRLAIGATLAVMAVGVAIGSYFVGALPVRFGLRPDAPAENTRFPWANATTDSPHPGVTRWRTRPASDGTVTTLLRFDFRVNPGLRFGIYDQDEDDAKPFDNKVLFWKRGVADATMHLDAQKRGTVIATWNGLFFAASGKTTAQHVGAVVIRGKVYGGGLPRHRWTFGTRAAPPGSPRFSAIHEPDAATLRGFSFAADAAQCLVQSGKALTLAPFPAPGAPPAKQPVPSTPTEAGHIPVVDHMRTTRASLGWTRDSRTLYLLFVKEPDSETVSIYAHRHGVPLAGGWTVADVQRFWLSLGVWGAVNSDGGDLAQLLVRTPTGYDLSPPRWSSRDLRQTYPHSRLADAPGGGSLMYFYVRDAGQVAQ